MIFFYIALLSLTLFGISYQPKNKCFEQYMSFSQTEAIKGIFIITVFFRHLFPYLTNADYTPNNSDIVFSFIDGHFGQLIVTMFLFYSGFGVQSSISKKGNSYVNSIPSKRIFKTIINFDIAVTLFAIANVILNIPITFKKYICSLVAWDSVGNSNWYIFVILFCYFATYMCAKIIVDQNGSGYML